MDAEQPIYEMNRTFGTKDFVNLKTMFMKRKQFFSGIAFAALTFSICIGLAWQTKPGVPNQLAATDTIPDRNNKIRNVDEAIEELDRAQQELDKAQKDFSKQRIREELDKAMQELQVAMTRLQDELKAAMKEVDSKKLQAEIQRNLSDAEAARVKAKVEEALAKVDFEKIQKEIARAQQVNTEKLRKELAELEPKISRSMAEAKLKIEEARKELKGYQSFIDDLHKDGLIDKQNDYRVEWKKGELSVNGKKQTEEVVRRYTFLTGHKDFTLVKGSEEFNIDTKED